MTGHLVTDVTLCLCALSAVEHWLVLHHESSASGSDDDYGLGCLYAPFVILFYLLPYAALGAVSFGVRSSLAASAILLCASVAMNASSFVIYRAMTREQKKSEEGVIAWLFLTWFVVLLSTGLACVVYGLGKFL
jgi:hypothetical protein